MKTITTSQFYQNSFENVRTRLSALKLETSRQKSSGRVSSLKCNFWCWSTIVIIKLMRQTN